MERVSHPRAHRYDGSGRWPLSEEPPAEAEMTPPRRLDQGIPDGMGEAMADQEGP